MPLSLESAQTVALGPFNPHIIDPEWLVREGVCADADVEIALLPFNEGMAFRFGEVQWEVDFRHLTVESRKVNCGELVAKVMGLLKHTPVRGISNRFHYACSEEEWRGSPVPRLGEVGPGVIEAQGPVEQTRWGCVFRMEDLRVEVTLAKEESGMVVLFGFHRETKGAEEAAVAAGQFVPDLQQSRHLVKRLFGQEVEP